MQKYVFFSLAAIILGCSAAHASEFSAPCYAEAESAAVKYVNAKYHTLSAHGGVAEDGEGDDIHVQVLVNGKTVCVDVGVNQGDNTCSLSSGKPELIDCNE